MNKEKLIKTQLVLLSFDSKTHENSLSIKPSDKIIYQDTLFPSIRYQKMSNYLNSFYNKRIKIYHLYVISDDRIKQFDWVMYTKGRKLHYKQLFFMDDVELANIKDSGVKKIIATTQMLSAKDNEGHHLEDSYLPNIPEEFIEKYIKKFNSGDVIKNVFVEYDKITNNGTDAFDYYYKLKINTNNSISIKLSPNYKSPTSTILEKLDEMIEQTIETEKLFKEKNMLTSELTSGAMAQAYKNVKYLILNSVKK